MGFAENRRREVCPSWILIGRVFFCWISTGEEGACAEAPADRALSLPCLYLSMPFFSLSGSATRERLRATVSLHISQAVSF